MYYRAATRMSRAQATGHRKSTFSTQLCRKPAMDISCRATSTCIFIQVWTTRKIAKMITVTIIIIFISLVLYYFHRKFQYFSYLGIPHEPGYFPFESKKVWTAFMGKGSLFQISEELFDKYPQEKVFGYFKPFGKPVLVIKDYDLAKRVMVKDFDHFVDRGFFQVHPETNPYMKYSLTFQNGEKWRQARGYVTPLFTSGKLKTMHPLITETVENMVEYLKKRNGQEIDGKDIFEKYIVGM